MCVPCCAACRGCVNLLPWGDMCVNAECCRQGRAAVCPYNRATALPGWLLIMHDCVSCVGYRLICGMCSASQLLHCFTRAAGGLRPGDNPPYVPPTGGAGMTIFCIWPLCEQLIHRICMLIQYLHFSKAQQLTIQLHTLIPQDNMQVAWCHPVCQIPQVGHLQYGNMLNTARMLTDHCDMHSAGRCAHRVLSRVQQTLRPAQRSVCRRDDCAVAEWVAHDAGVGHVGRMCISLAQLLRLCMQQPVRVDMCSAPHVAEQIAAVMEAHSASYRRVTSCSWLKHI
jgi:hypothetical protein